MGDEDAADLTWGLTAALAAPASPGAGGVPGSWFIRQLQPPPADQNLHLWKVPGLHAHSSLRQLLEEEAS